MSCLLHPNRSASYRCTNCDVHWCDECAVGGCPDCGSLLESVDRRRRTDGGGAPDGGQKPTPYAPPGSASSDYGANDPSFFAQLPGAFFYPFAGDGWILLLLATLFTVGISCGFFIPFLGLFVALILLGYLWHYFFDIITASANGRDELPDLPEWTDFFSSCLVPLFRFLAVAVLAFGPAVAALVMEQESMAVLLGAVGVLYFPMGLLGVALDESVLGLNPIRAVTSMVKIPGQYLVATLLLGVVVTISNLLTGALGESGLVGALVATPISLYFLTVEARILGLLYHANQRRLSWYE